MSGAADKDVPPVVPPKERSPSPDDGLLREEPLDEPTTTKPLKSTDVPTVTAPPAASQTVTAPPAPTVESVAEEGEEVPPPKPPRPVSKLEQNVATLAEAFPDIDVSVIKAVLTASGGRVEPAFNALLGMSDPSAAVEIEETPPPQPPRPRQQQQQPRDFRSSDHYNPANVYNDQAQPQTSTPASQMEADELYARQLAEHYGGLPRESRESRQGRGGYGNYPEQQHQQHQQQQRRRQHPQEEEDDRERSFFDDDLPVLRDNLKKGFLDTQTKFNKFLTDFSKKITGEEEEGQNQQQQQQQHYGAGRGQGQAQGQGQRSQQYPQRYSSRRSGEGYDADPEVIQGDFSHLELRDNSDEPRRRPLANPNLFGSNPTNPSGAPRKTVGFAEQSEEDLYRKPTITTTSNTNSSNPASATGPAPTTGSKWAPLATVDPTPISNDPFQLADSDDEHDNIQTTSTKTGPQETGTKNTTTTK
ncbi:hypothetical protein AOL_s00188g66 [Orbilia oligospora ATCC 24927]|uniref:CUE domain-containing protein n=1 Tax=Arthrobotrys oligospora (strain ATCC 24927 / CBS 115.81 / DSM 1491) TaxID=756982 RepID=G1XQ55_ARTOA|nr:hypothetical protein AOL_s00188g66 [Orbilia oligospora ATCC 24927]EGX44728.1 hypothetical protein AOL_s00188g66 [Orbilia oligospora ATCC 24927]